MDIKFPDRNPIKNYDISEISYKIAVKYMKRRNDSPKIILCHPNLKNEVFEYFKDIRFICDDLLKSDEWIIIGDSIGFRSRGA